MSSLEGEDFVLRVPLKWLTAAKSEHVDERYERYAVEFTTERGVKLSFAVNKQTFDAAWRWLTVKE